MKKVTILYTSDVHGKKEIFNYSDVARRRKELTDAGENCIVLDSGDFSGGKAAKKSGITKENIKIGQYDAIAIGNHDFQDYTYDELVKTELPLVCCNVVDKITLKPLFKPYKIFDFGDSKIGVLGIGYGTLSGIKNTRIKSTALNTLIQSYIDEMRSAGSTHIVGIFHLAEGDVKKIIAKISGMDIALMGHSHKNVINTIVKDKNKNNVVCSQAGRYFKALGELSITDEGISPMIYTKYSDLPKIIEEKEEEIIPIVPEVIINDFDYDLIDNTQYKEIDIIYTADIHNTWYGSQDKNNLSLSSKINYDKVKAAKDKLEKSGIKTLLIDGGDYSHITPGHCKSADPVNNKDFGQAAIDSMNKIGYFASTIGNHELYYAIENNAIVGKNSKYSGNLEICLNQLNKVNSLICCNIVNPKDNSTIFKPFKTAKIGDKRIAVIGITYDFNVVNADNNYPFPVDQYKWIVGSELHTLIQSYIDYFKKERNFDYVCCVMHGGIDNNKDCINATDIINNTSGLDLIMTAHSHAKTNHVTKKDKSGKAVNIAAQPQCYATYMTRIRINDSGITSARCTSI